MNKPKPRRPVVDEITMDDLDAILFPRLPVDVRKLTIEQAQLLYRQLKEILR